VIIMPPAPASAGEAAVRIAHLLRAPADEVIDVALIVGEQDVALEMLGLGAGKWRSRARLKSVRSASNKGQRLGARRPWASHTPSAISSPIWARSVAREAAHQVGAAITSATSTPSPST
jgi:hypothetical protein